ncbi:AtsE protein [Acetobacter estunensis NRIC 0472]|uniref:Host attachment protein n=1 Tax=Acetobacter estunensis TaxID=104097 RepID=A0A967BBS7_9PROT|nr:host attachment protein [Acetobacter estunensis]MBV1838640.1 host attachment protein [Acetobacter estunensis]NHO54123.1 hypothetical protein [Acetobacter estunensis]GBQ20792.1 AtsE protein [Acetobacter estunensis NRIC 0472]
MAESLDGKVVYIVADGGKARILHHKDGHMHEVSSFAAAEIAGSSDNGRGDFSVADHHKEEFGRRVAKWMNDALHGSNTPDGFVLAAPAKVLHVIREHLAKPTQAKLIKSIDKDLINIPTNDLVSHFDIPETGWQTA